MRRDDNGQKVKRDMTAVLFYLLVFLKSWMKTKSSSPSVSAFALFPSVDSDATLIHPDMS